MKYKFTDENRKALIEKRQKAIVEAFEDLKDLSLIVLGKDVEIDYSEYLRSPVEYLTDKFYELYAVKVPDHIVPNKGLIMQQMTGISISDIVQAYKVFNSSMTTDRELMPTVTPTGLKSIVSEKDWSYTIPKDKRKQYDLSVKFQEAFNDLVKVFNDSPYNLIQTKFNDVFQEENNKWIAKPEAFR